MPSKKFVSKRSGPSKKKRRRLGNKKSEKLKGAVRQVIEKIPVEQVNKYSRMNPQKIEEILGSSVP